MSKNSISGIWDDFEIRDKKAIKLKYTDNKVINDVINKVMEELDGIAGIYF